MLFNEPKLLKFRGGGTDVSAPIRCFSALQRAEIAEIGQTALPRRRIVCFSALQRAEIAEMALLFRPSQLPPPVSVLFNEPKLLKSHSAVRLRRCC